MAAAAVFRLIDAPTYWWPVEFRTPAAERPGEFDEHTIEVKYRFLDDDEHRALMDAVAAESLKDPAFCPRVVVGFRGIEDPHGHELLYSPDALATILRVPGLATAIARTYFDSRAKAAEKNS